ncbi:hypothetical protein GGI26_002424 [Coemansia sp. RSA 1358]|uniref:DUF1748-domain-containing protein n=1 Tax=Coemansia umbellata TaxID=1424467 RepID=A0ABQ8PN01_9FUNG|nr:hypothetical protein BX070DRAFT_152664 [Coemansia spiralis]KAJ1992272.1 hypothetical protein EDC05_002940 [Coemansia umbellata]KAJ2623386.1 hypothetical protein GGI26_002424 [Coemansia sp. RSA 1358]
MAVIGKVVHISIDLVLVSTALAGIRRSAGLTLAANDPSSAIYSTAKQYLEVGERVIDYVQPWVANSKYFKRE